MSATILPFERPKSIGEVLDAGIALFKASLVRCLPLSLVAVVVGQLPSVVAMARGRTPSLSDIGAAEAVLVLLAGLANVLIWGAILLRQQAIGHGRRSSLGADLGRPLALLLPSLAMAVVGGLLVAAGLVALLVPGLYLMVALVFAYPAMLIDGESVAGSLRASLRLVRGNWWRTAAIITVALFAILVFYSIGTLTGLVIVQVTGGGDVGSVFLATSIVSALVGALFTPFMCALSLAQYADLKLRRAGEDLARRIEALPGA
ncbi:MAG: glycerophosphoryl diester phosphodiesterase membrane domain-containing protein [Steroidobacteraceae bacterium]|jgi:hypothetical protein|nr:glycerophosphoryl diester phosphodiesterase membrane domain-containing protein [Steroidobacteraceae bacterium]